MWLVEIVAIVFVFDLCAVDREGVEGDRRCDHTQTIAIVCVSDGCKGQEHSKARRWRQNEGRYT
jgi:hypothetical protein